MSTDRIEKTIVLRAPRERVWRALTESSEFGSWFGLRIDRPFVVGGTVPVEIQPTTVDADVARDQEPYRGVRFTLQIVRLDRPSAFAFRWHPQYPGAPEDVTQRPTTLVEFSLEETSEGTRLTVVESGFDQVPLPHRERSARGNEAGWAKQMQVIRQFLERRP
jgi:uncharacterized protein YndB with AHSA1/START domain